MKKHLVLLLFTALALSSCEEDEQLESIVIKAQTISHAETADSTAADAPAPLTAATEEN
ncbi:MAG: hypothetical protein LPK07_03490 [Hymenobacteraceae bacterium]|nr:hypothetical protein [Hymenobacteraceae bacterium]